MFITLTKEDKLETNVKALLNSLRGLDESDLVDLVNDPLAQNNAAFQEAYKIWQAERALLAVVEVEGGIQ